MDNLPLWIWPVGAVIFGILLWGINDSRATDTVGILMAVAIVGVPVLGIVLLISDGKPVVLHNSLEGKILAPLAYTPLAGLLLLYLALFTGVLGRSGSARLLFALVGLAILTSGVWLGGGTP